MLRVVFMGTPDFAVPSLNALLEDREHFHVVAVYSQPDRPVGRGLELKAPPVKELALKHGVPVCQPETLSGESEVKALQELAPDVIVVAAYGQLLRQNVLDIPRLGCVNIHSSLLPRWRGAAPIQWAILAGDSETGVTTMRMVRKLDAGDILLQKSTPISDRETAGSLHDRLAIMGAELIGPTLTGLESGTLQGKPQDEALVTYATKLSREMQWLDPEQSAVELDRRIRALNPWPGTSVRVEVAPGRLERLKIRSAIPLGESAIGKGNIQKLNGKLVLGTSNGALELLRLQWEGKKEGNPEDFLNGLVGRKLSLPLKVAGQVSGPNGDSK